MRRFRSEGLILSDFKEDRRCRRRAWVARMVLVARSGPLTVSRHSGPLQSLKAFIRRSGALTCGMTTPSRDVGVGHRLFVLILKVSDTRTIRAARQNTAGGVFPCF